MPVKSLYACGSNLLGHIIPRSRDSNCGALDNFDQHELITQPHRVFANVGDARVLYAGLADVLLECSTPSRPSPTLYLRGSTPTRLLPSIHPDGELNLPPTHPNLISHGFGTPTGEFLGVVLANHEGIQLLQAQDSRLGWTGGADVWWEAIPGVDTEEVSNVKGRMVDISVAGNGDVAVVMEWGGQEEWGGRIQDGVKRWKWYTLQIYPSLDSLFPSSPSSPPFSTTMPTCNLTLTSTYPLPPSHIPTTLTSTLTSHALLLQPTPLFVSPALSSHSPLSHNQSQSYPPYPLILTTGDQRHPFLLLHSQDPTNASTTGRQLLPLAPLEGLQDLVLLEADPGGWEVAVMDGGGGVYLFGGQAGGEGLGLKDVVAAAQVGGFGEDVILVDTPLLLLSASGEEGEEEGGEEREENGNTSIPQQDPEDDSPGIQDVALGSSHLLALIDSGEVFGIGWGEEGQLGCGGRNENGKGRESWVRMDFGKERKVKVEKVWAGAWESWMLVEEEEVVVLEG